MKLALVLLALMMTASVAPALALYEVPLPSNIVYADDFENYQTTTCASSALLCLPNWGAYDNISTGSPIANITNLHFRSPSHSLMLQASSTAGGKFDRHIAFPLLAGMTRFSISGWFMFDQAMVSDTNRNTFHFSAELVGNDVNFHECLWEYFPFATQKDSQFRENDAVFNFNATLRAFDSGGFNNNPNSLWNNNAWHYSKITVDFTNPGNPSCIYMQIDALVLSSQQGYVTTPSTAKSNTQYNTANGYLNTRPGRMEIATIAGSGGVNWHVWWDNVQITNDTPGQNAIQFAFFQNAFYFAAFVAGMVTVSFGALWNRSNRDKADVTKKIVAFAAVGVVIVIVLVFTGFFFGTQQAANTPPQPVQF